MTSNQMLDAHCHLLGSYAPDNNYLEYCGLWEIQWSVMTALYIIIETYISMIITYCLSIVLRVTSIFLSLQAITTSTAICAATTNTATTIIIIIIRKPTLDAK